MPPSHVFLAATLLVAASGAIEAAFGPNTTTPNNSPAFLIGPDGAMPARSVGGWCPKPPNAFVPCTGGPDRIQIRPATAAEAGLLSGASGAAAPWRLEGWAERAAALGIEPSAGDAPDADLSAAALAVAVNLPPATFLAAVPAGGIPGQRRATLDLSRPDSGPRPWRVTLTEIRLHMGYVWTIEAETWLSVTPHARVLAQLRDAIETVLDGISPPAPIDPATQAWARIARPDGPDRGAGRAIPLTNGGWRLYGLPPEPDALAEALAEEAAPLLPALANALAIGAIDDSLVLAFAHAAIRAASGPPSPLWRPAAAACGRGLLVADGLRICLLPDGRAAAAHDMPDGTRHVLPLARAPTP